MKISEIRTITSVLSREVGLRWPLILVKSLTRRREVLNSTRWAKEESTESEFARRLSISAAIYLNLLERTEKEKAFEIMRKILVPIGCDEQMDNLDALNVSNRPSMERLLAFYDFMGAGGVGQFVERKLIQKDEDRLHYEVRNCFFHRFYQEVGVPELAKLFCKVDEQFFPRAFPDFKFHRGGSSQNTVAYGRDRCVFIFDRRNT